MCLASQNAVVISRSTLPFTSVIQPTSLRRLFTCSVHQTKFDARRPPQRPKMTTSGGPARARATETALSRAMNSLGLDSTPRLPNTYPTLNPLDIYRSHLAQLLVQSLAPIATFEPSTILPSLHWTQTLEKGDLTLPVPALKLKGRKPDEIAKTIVDQVITSRPL